jgi:ribosome maturation factor RimP
VRGDIGERVRVATCDLVRGLGLELADVSIVRDRGRVVLRIAVDKAGGVTLDDCAEASNLLGQVLDREGVMPGQYVLEVMSPGLDRPLRRPEDFTQSVGRRVRVKLRQPFEGQRSFSGILREAGEGSLLLDMGNELLELKYECLTAARLDPELPW